MSWLVWCQCGAGGLLLAGYLVVPFMYPLVPWLHVWPPGWLFWCLCVGGCWVSHLGWLLLCGRLAAFLLQCKAVGLRLGANILLLEGYIPSCLQKVNILPSKSRHRALLYHLVLLPAQEEQLLHLQPAMTVHYPTSSPPLLHQHVKRGLHLCWGSTTSCPPDASSTRTSHPST